LQQVDGVFVQVALLRPAKVELGDQTRKTTSELMVRLLVLTILRSSGVSGVNSNWREPSTGTASGCSIWTAWRVSRLWVVIQVPAHSMRQK